MPATAANESCQPGSPATRGLTSSVAATASSSTYQRDAGRPATAAASPASAHRPGPLERRAGAGQRHVQRHERTDAREPGPHAQSRERQQRQRQRSEQHHVLAAHREQVREARAAEVVLHVRRDSLVLAEHHARQEVAVSPAEPRPRRRAPRAARRPSTTPAGPPRLRPVASRRATASSKRMPAAPQVGRVVERLARASLRALQDAAQLELRARPLRGPAQRRRHQRQHVRAARRTRDQLELCAGAEAGRPRQLEQIRPYRERVAIVERAVRRVERVKPPRAPPSRAADDEHRSDRPQGRRPQRASPMPTTRAASAAAENGAPHTSSPPANAASPTWYGPARAHPRSLRPPARRFQTLPLRARQESVEKSLPTAGTREDRVIQRRGPSRPAWPHTNVHGSRAAFPACTSRGSDRQAERGVTNTTAQTRKRLPRSTKSTWSLLDRAARTTTPGRKVLS